MGCRFSKPSQEEVGNVMSLCRERKGLIRSAVESRQALAQAHCKYSQSLYAVALAIRLFVARHSSSSSPFLIAFPQYSEATGESLVFRPMYHQNRPFESVVHEAIPCKAKDSAISSHTSNPNGETEDKEEKEEEEGDGDDDDAEGEVCEHFYDGAEPPPMPSTQNNFGWDFFNPFDGFGTEVFSGLPQGSDDRAGAVKEAKGMPEMEEVKERKYKESNALMENGGLKQNGDEGKRVVMDANISQGESSEGLSVFDTQTNGRQLLEALKDVEDHFIKAYNSSVDVSKMLETNMVHLQSGLEEIKENSNKLIQSITWHESMSSQSSSCKSFLSFSSKSSSACSEFSDDLFDQYNGMESGSHSSTLGRLYAWEKKLYEEVKAGNRMRRIYESKCSQLTNQGTKRHSLGSEDKANAEASELFSRISVTLRSAESISKRIQKLRDEELQPQLVELLLGLKNMWKVMLESHQSQNQTMCQVKSFTCPDSGKFNHDSHRLVTLQLEGEIRNWRACFVEYVSAQKAYVKAVNGWLSQFIAPEISLYSRDSSVPQCRINRPPLAVICHDWLALLQKLPVRTVKLAMKNFGKVIRALWIQQGVEQHQKKKVHELKLELDRRILAFQQEEGKFQDSELSQQKTEVGIQRRFEYLSERKSLLDVLRNRLEAEKAKHHDNMLETQRIILNGFHTGFSSVFDSLIEFSMASVRMYTDLVAHGKNAKLGVEKGDLTTINEKCPQAKANNLLLKRVRKEN